MTKIFTVPKTMSMTVVKLCNKAISRLFMSLLSTSKTCCVRPSAMDNGTFETVVTAMVKWVIPAYGVVTSSCLYVLGSTPKAYFVLRSVMDTDDPASCCNVFMFGHILVTLASFFLTRLWTRAISMDERHILNTNLLIIHFLEGSVLGGFASLINNDLQARSLLQKMIFPYLISKCIVCLAFAHDSVRNYILHRPLFWPIRRMQETRIARRIAGASGFSSA